MFFSSPKGPPTHRYVDRDPDVIAQERTAQADALERMRVAAHASLPRWGGPDAWSAEQQIMEDMKATGEDGHGRRQAIEQEIQNRGRPGVGRAEDRLYGDVDLDFLMDYQTAQTAVETKELVPIEPTGFDIDKTSLQSEARAGVLKLGAPDPAARRKGKREFMAPKQGAQI